MKWDGGPVFPQDLQGRRGDDPHLQGMSLRDWFAGNAREEDIQAHMTYYSEGNSFSRTREAAKYAYADAMLKAREASND